MRKLLGALVWPAALALGLAAEAAEYPWDEPHLWVPDLAVGLTFIACGRLVFERRHGAGALLAATGIAWFLGTFDADLLYLHRGPLVNLVLAYPGARPRSRLDAAAVAVGYALTPFWDSDALTVAFSLALVALASRSSIGASRPERRERRFALAAATALAVAFVGGAAAPAAVPAYDAVLLSIAIGLSVGLRRPAATAVADLVVELGETRSGLLRDRLARALGDPTLEVGYWLSEAGAFVDDTGQPLALPGPQSERSLTRIEREGSPFAVLVHDAAVLGEPALVEAVASAARLTASNVELQAERRARARELVASRRRLLVAADRERRSLEARLQRGPERRLADVDDILAGVPASATDEHLERARRQLARTLVDLHELAHGLHPRELADGGLPGALAALAERAPLPVDLQVDVERLPDEIEATVYFVCAEALANVAKYASATRVQLTVEAVDGRLALRVADDGIGGADRSRGTGLQGLADRVETLGGTLDVSSPPGAGTLLRAAIPLAPDPLPRLGEHGVGDRRRPRT